MSASGVGSKFGAEHDAAEGKDQIAPGKSPAPASPPSPERLRFVLEHNRGIRSDLCADQDFDPETAIAYAYIDGFVKGLEYALGIKPLK